jgi:hypothetical protein
MERGLVEMAELDSTPSPPRAYPYFAVTYFSYSILRYILTAGID